VGRSRGGGRVVSGGLRAEVFVGVEGEGERGLMSNFGAGGRFEVLRDEGFEKEEWRGEKRAAR